VRDYVGNPFAFVTWVMRSWVLLKAFRELDCLVLVPFFYKVFEYSTFFNRVAQHTMVGAKFAFACSVYDLGSLAGGECQSAFQGLLEYPSCFALQKRVWHIFLDFKGLYGS
jgi:hypothetical protein